MKKKQEASANGAAPDLNTDKQPNENATGAAGSKRLRKRDRQQRQGGQPGDEAYGHEDLLQQL